MPASIRRAVRLMWVGAGLSLLGIGDVFLRADEVRREIEEADPAVSGVDADRAVTTVLTVLGLFGVLIASIWLWMAVANAEGKLWARRTATGLGAAYLASAVLRLGGGAVTALGALLTVGTAALVVAVLWLLHREDASRYYESSSP